MDRIIELYEILQPIGMFAGNTGIHEQGNASLRHESNAPNLIKNSLREISQNDI